jgi:hypothetical protein
VLQVPTAEALRGIEQTQELLQEIGARGNVSPDSQLAAPVVKGEGSNHGGKL